MFFTLEFLGKILVLRLYRFFSEWILTVPPQGAQALICVSVVYFSVYLF